MEYRRSVCLHIIPRSPQSVRMPSRIPRPILLRDVSELWPVERYIRKFRSNDSHRGTPPIFLLREVRVLSAVWNNKFGNVSRFFSTLAGVSSSNPAAVQNDLNRLRKDALLFAKDAMNIKTQLFVYVSRIYLSLYIRYK